MRALMLIPVLLALAACGDAGAGGADGTRDLAGGSGSETGDAGTSIAPAGRFEPGKWAATIKIEDVSAPQMQPAMADGLKRMFASLEPIQTCLSEAEARRPAADFFLGKTRADCRYDRFAMANGTIDAQLSCSRDGARQAMTLQGSYSPDTYNLLVTTTVSGEGRPDLGALRMRMSVSARRIGQCDGSEAGGTF